MGQYCTCGKVTENKDTGECASCGHERRKAELVPYKVVGKIDINKYSTERTRLEHKYKRKLRSWRTGKRCKGKFEHKCSSFITCHHQMGRIGFADDWARENDVPLLIDERYWMPLCFEAHRYIELNPNFAKENGYSYSRLAKI